MQFSLNRTEPASQALRCPPLPRALYAMKRGVHHGKCTFLIHVKQLENIKSTLSAAKVNLGQRIGTQQLDG